MVVGHTPPTVECRTGERGSGLVPGTARGSNAVRPGVKDAAPPGSPQSRERCRLREWGELRPQRCARRKVLRVTQRGLALVHPLRDAGEPSVVRGDDVALLLVSQAVGVGNGLSAERTSPTVPQVLQALWMRAAGRRTSTLHSAAVPSLGTRWERLAHPAGFSEPKEEPPGFSGGKRWKSQKSRMSIATSPLLRQWVTAPPGQSV